LIKSIVFICLAIFWALFTAGCGPSRDTDTATVAVAANFKTTLAELEADFEHSSSHTIELVTGSTGKLYAQIRFGAPYHVFLAADQERPRRLIEEGLALPESQFTYAQGRLVAWSKQRSEIGPSAFTEADVARVAIANPDLAPYGRAASQVLSELGIAAAVTPKLVLGENVGQAFAFVATGNAQIGLVSEAQVLSLPAQDQANIWHPPSSLYDPINQDAVLLTSGASNAAAQAFISYLQSPRAKDIIARHGYELP
jgi:molybdate transport system substrate-binding protein